MRNTFHILLPFSESEPLWKGGRWKVEIILLIYLFNLTIFLLLWKFPVTGNNMSLSAYPIFNRLLTQTLESQSHQTLMVNTFHFCCLLYQCIYNYVHPTFFSSRRLGVLSKSNTQPPEIFIVCFQNHVPFVLSFSSISLFLSLFLLLLVCSLNI